MKCGKVAWCRGAVVLWCCGAVGRGAKWLERASCKSLPLMVTVEGPNRRTFLCHQVYLPIGTFQIQLKSLT